MKTKHLIFLSLTLVACTKDTSTLFTSVEGLVSDYYSQSPVNGIPLLITKNGLCTLCHDNIVVLDTVWTNAEGRYYFEFFTDSSRFNYYQVEVVSSESYGLSPTQTIIAGEKNDLDFSIKPYKCLTLILCNNKKVFNGAIAFNPNYKFKTEFFSCENEDKCDSVFNIIPGAKNFIDFIFQRKNSSGSIDSSLYLSMEFMAGRNDTTITYYY